MREAPPSNSPNGVRWLKQVIETEGVLGVGRTAFASAAAPADGTRVCLPQVQPAAGQSGRIHASGVVTIEHAAMEALTGLKVLTRAALPALHASKSAAIVNTCSVAATASLPDRALYSASKGAVLSLTHAMAADTSSVNLLLQASRDPQAERAALLARQPHERLVSADEIARPIAYLALPHSNSTTGTNLAVDGGMSALRLRPPTPRVAE